MLQSLPGREVMFAGRPGFYSSIRLFVFFVFAAIGFVAVRAGEFFEEVRVLDGGGDFVGSAGPFAEVEEAAAVGAEGEVLAGGEDDFAAGGAEEGF